MFLPRHIMLETGILRVILIPLVLLFLIEHLLLIPGGLPAMDLQSMHTVVLVEVTGIRIEKGTKRG